MADSEFNLAGGCQCGAVRYVLDAPPERIYICHCRECRKQSASAFGISVIVRREAVRLVEGKLECWSRPTDSGRLLDCHFCSRCGSRLWHGNMQTGKTLSVKGGSLDEPVDVSGAYHIWVSRKLPGIVIPPEARRFTGEPDEPN
jgi:hypothetical protein